MHPPAEDKICINSLFENRTDTDYFDRCLFANHLEEIVGNYKFSERDKVITAGRLYYDASVDSDEASIEETEENLIAYVFFDVSIIFVKTDFRKKLENDTRYFEFQYVPVESFDNGLLCVDTNRLPETLKNILWIDDDFLDDENLPFDDDAFIVIDSGEEYLNPSHFSVGKFLRQYVRSDNV